MLLVSTGLGLVKTTGLLFEKNQEQALGLDFLLPSIYQLLTAVHMECKAQIEILLLQSL